MPIYEYKCQSCGIQSEVMQRLSEAPRETCEECGGELKKLISAPAFQFKGTGWYVTDYAGKSGANGKEDGAPKEKDSAKKESKSESSSSTSSSSGDSSSASSSSSSSGEGKAKSADG